jgi:hypothetical protein
MLGRLEKIFSIVLSGKIPAAWTVRFRGFPMSIATFSQSTNYARSAWLSRGKAGDVLEAGGSPPREASKSGRAGLTLRRCVDGDPLSP